MSSVSGVSSHEKNYPPLLREVSGAPEHLFFLGNPVAWSGPLVAVVGTRKATAEGRRLAKRISERFARAGIGVVSGLALGIDAAAHEGALSGKGATVAVLGNGLPHIYPVANERLAGEILRSGGAIISEYPLDAPALPHQFLERNRIISGLTLATVVIEAPEHSGSLSTARHALEQGREVFVFPGPAEHPAWRGSHWLIREGARLAASFEDIREDMASLFAGTRPPDAPVEAHDAFRHESGAQTVLSILKELGGSGKTEDIVAASGLDPEAALAALSFLTIEGEIEEREGGFCIKR